MISTNRQTDRTTTTYDHTCECIGTHIHTCTHRDMHMHTHNLKKHNKGAVKNRQNDEQVVERSPLYNKETGNTTTHMSTHSVLSSWFCQAITVLAFWILFAWMTWSCFG